MTWEFTGVNGLLRVLAPQNGVYSLLILAAAATKRALSGAAVPCFLLKKDLVLTRS
jgi:hypothetical protein